ncbi:alpha/beta hydrolase [Fervidibacillus albus]|uniref:Alpha/beta hydrolase n=1 Tax=Fervidibacillus albus TaxID=2980026 RepID=A0A9E8RXH9_9BACI|nr:alpha/beta hydrolase [Fervidibacillus albus]WAA11264.1 alpha/beta hydrolase [Fervidibacillus albus]
MKRRIRIILITFLTIVAIAIGGFFLYTSNYYRADAAAVSILSDENVQHEDGMWVFYPDVDVDQKVGLIFYPGGKVEETAYAPLLAKLTEKGITSVLIEMPFHLAIFHIDGADDVYEKFPEIDHWFLAGHSLGGAMASSYASEHEDQLSGLILLGAYPTDELMIPTIAIYGSEDQVLDKEKLKVVENRIEITGGNHAGFGNYGEQKGDGTAQITNDQQQELTVEHIVTFIESATGISFNE